MLKLRRYWAFSEYSTAGDWNVVGTPFTLRRRHEGVHWFIQVEQFPLDGRIITAALTYQYNTWLRQHGLQGAYPTRAQALDALSLVCEHEETLIWNH